MRTLEETLRLRNALYWFLGAAQRADISRYDAHMAENFRVAAEVIAEKLEDDEEGRG